MKTTKHMKQLLTWVLLGSLSLSVSSCKDSDDDSPLSAEEQAAQEAAAQQTKAAKFWGVVGQLVGSSAICDDYEQQTFEPLLGTADPQNPLCRVVNTNSMEQAARRFADLVGDTLGLISETTTEYKWSDPDVGTLVYRKSSDGTAWATVDVQIDQVPHLQRIVYREPSQGDSNASYPGGAHYRFGDVISRPNADGQLEYWICVRPAFAQEKKDHTHWMTVSPMPQKNWWTYHSSTTNQDYSLPKNIGVNKEHMQNLAELLYAMFYSSRWQQNIEQYSTEGLFGPGGLPIFGDFHKSNVKYHSRYYWQRVRKGWESHNLFTRVFGMESEDMATVVQDGLDFLVEGSAWSTTFSNSPTLYQYHYERAGEKDTERNMHAVSYSKVSRQVIDKRNPQNNIELDIRKIYTQAHPYYTNRRFFGDDRPRFIVRYATGEELMGSEPNVYQSMHEVNGIKDVYLYNAQYNYYVGASEKCVPADLSQNPELATNNTPTSALDGQTGGLYCQGDVLMDEEGYRWFCLNGRPKGIYNMFNGMDAFFVTTEGIEFTPYKATNIIKEEEAMDLAVRICEFINDICHSTDSELAWTEINNRGLIVNHIMQHAGVDFTQLLTIRDSIFHFTNNKGKAYDSPSKSVCINLAYDDGSEFEQPILRIVVDGTLGGGERNNCVTLSGKNLQDIYFRIYKHYEEYDPTKMRELTADEKGLGLTKWQTPWPVTDRKMKLQDVMSSFMVGWHGGMDKWVRLPYWTPQGTKANGRARTTAEEHCLPKDYAWDSKNRKPVEPNKRTIFNERVLFLRTMTIRDNGGTEPNLVSNDGRRLSVVSLTNSKKVYQQSNQGNTWMYYNAHMEGGLYELDNKVYHHPLAE